VSASSHTFSRFASIARSESQSAHVSQHILQALFLQNLLNIGILFLSMPCPYAFVPGSLLGPLLGTLSLLSLTFSLLQVPSFGIGVGGGGRNTVHGVDVHSGVSHDDRTADSVAGFL
jgi:hypothetical protein